MALQKDEKIVQISVVPAYQYYKDELPIEPNVIALTNYGNVYWQRYTDFVDMVENGS